jgi:hypothetical protein
MAYFEHNFLLIDGLVLNMTNTIGIIILYSTGFLGYFAARRQKKAGLNRLKIFAPK